MQKRVLLVSCVMLLVVGLAANVLAGDVLNEVRDASVISKVVKRGTLRVGFSTFKPWAMKDKTGNFVGFEVDVMKRFAKDLGVGIEFVPTSWSGIIPALLADKFDMIIGGMSVTTPRSLKVNFSDPYDTSGIGIMANRKKAAGMNSLEAFNAKGVVITARIGSTPATIAKKMFPKASLRLFDKETQCVQEVLNGRAHAMLSSAPLPAFTVLEHPKRLFLPVKNTFAQEPIAIALRKGDVDTLNVVNNWIRLRLGDGWLTERKSYWFGTKDWESLLK